MRLDPELVGVWSVTCFVVGKGFRRQGLMYELAAATVEYGRQVGPASWRASHRASAREDRDLG